MPRVIRKQQYDTTMEGRTRDDYSYIAVLKAQRQAVETSLGIDSEKYGYRDFSSFCKNMFGYYIEEFERTHSILQAKDYATEKVLEGGQKYGKPYSMKPNCVCECHEQGMKALEAIRKVKNSINKSDIFDEITTEEPIKK